MKITDKLFVLVMLVIAWMVFSHISVPIILIWDEAVYANNAVEMFSGGNWWVLKVDGEPTFYNVKPPLVIWLQSLAMALFGINEFSVRLPSALAALGTIFLMYRFSVKALGSPWIGLLASITLILSEGYFRYHVVRTADLDGVLVFFVCWYTLTYVSFLLDKEDTSLRGTLIKTTILVFLAFMAKSYAGLMPVPGLVLATLWSTKRSLILRSKYLYQCACGLVVAVVLYYLFKEIAQPGYFASVYHSEFRRLYANVMPWQNHPFGFYFRNWFSRPSYSPFIYFVLASPILFIKNWPVKPKVRQFILFGLLWSLGYFLIISTPIVKLSWYDAPLYPVFSLITAVVLVSIIQIIQRFDLPGLIKWILIIGLLFPVYYGPIARTYKKLVTIPELKEQEKPGDFMRRLEKEDSPYRSFTVIYSPPYLFDEHLDQIRFYQKKLNLERNYRIDIQKNLSNIGLADTILTCQQSKVDSLEALYEIKVLEKNESCGLLYLMGPQQ